MITRKWERDRLAVVRQRLRALVTPGSTCAVADEHKEAVRMYVETWILPHVDCLLGDVVRNSCEDLGDEGVRP